MYVDLPEPLNHKVESFDKGNCCSIKLENCFKVGISWFIKVVGIFSFYNSRQLSNIRKFYTTFCVY